MRYEDIFSARVWKNKQTNNGFCNRFGLSIETKVASTAINYYFFQFSSKGLFDIILREVNDCF